MSHGVGSITFPRKRPGQAAAQHAVQGQFGSHDIGRDASQVEHEALDAEASLASLGDLLLDVVEITFTRRR